MNSSTAGAAATAAALGARVQGGAPLLPALARTIWRPLATSAALFLLQVCCSLATPVIIHQLLTWVGADAPDVASGVGYVLALAAASTLGFACEWGVECLAREHAGSTCRAVAAALVYDKVLRTSAVDAQRTHSGETTSLFSADAAALTELPHGAVVMALQPLEIGGLVALLALYVEWAALGGLAVVAAAMLTLQLAGHRLERLLAARSAVTDVRVRDTLEMLAGMRAVKLAALEPKFVGAIRAARRAESALARASRWAYGAVNTTSSNGVDVISVAVILVWTLAQARTLTPAVTFTYWVILSLLHGRIFSFPVAFKKVRDGVGAASRLESFLRRPERRDTRQLLPLLEEPPSPPSLQEAAEGTAAPPPAPGCVVRVRQGYFSWALRAAADSGEARAEAASLLRGIQLSLHAGELGVLVGAVGSGKSSVLAALLGEMDAVGCDGGDAGSLSRVELATAGGPIGFVPQQAFVVSGTVQDNIVFGRAWDAARYAAVLEACALGPDLASWPHGDQSHVGAFTLSGGQKQRLSIARCVYGRHALYLFDDCLSALDARVGRHVLERVVSGPLLAGSTRLLVTSSGAALRHADRVGVMLPVQAVPRAAHTAGAVASSPALSALLHAQPDLLQSPGGSAPPSSAATAPSSSKGEAGPFTLLWGTRASMHDDSFVAPLVTALVGRSSSSVDALPAPQLAPPGSLGATEGPSLQLQGGEQAAPMPPAALEAFASARALAEPHLRAAPRRRIAMPFCRSWMMGAGGPVYAGGVLLLLAAEATAVEVGVYVLAWWSEDPQFLRFSYAQYVWMYCLLVALELASAYARQHVYITGITRAADHLHDGLLLRLGVAPQSFFDTRSAGSLIDLVGRQLGHLDSGTLYASEYFWLGCAYGLLIILVEVIISPWVLLPGALCVGLLWWVVSEAGAVGDSDGGEEDGGERAHDAEEAGQAAAASLGASEAPRGAGRRPARRPTVAALMSRESAASVRSLEHFTQSLEGLPSLRAMHAQGRALQLHHELADAHAREWAAVASAQARLVLLGNLCGALYYILSVALIVPLRVASAASGVGAGERPTISGGDAGFIVVNSAFASYMCTMVLQQRGALLDLALTRGDLVAALCEMPREVGTGGGPGEEGELAASDARFRRHYDAMMRAGRRAPHPAAPPPLSGGESRDGCCAPAGGMWWRGGLMGPLAAPRHHLTVAMHGATAAKQLDAEDSSPAAAAAAAVSAGSRSGPAHPSPTPPPAGWPTAGHVVIESLCLRYGPALPLVLRGVCLEVAPGSTVTVIGRTGAGKSSLVAALLRLVEPASGRILIDGVDVATLPLRALRGGVVVVSQDALFFSGSLRRNLDPFKEHGDEALLAALRQVRLLEFAAAAAATAATAAAADAGLGSPLAAPAAASPLDMPISERGGNLSAGQQQLLALVRALLRRPRLLVLDEATASLDAASEEAVAATVSSAFPNTTVLQVAHRLAACARADAVVVMEDGRVGEAGPPDALLAGTVGRGLFAGLIAALPPGARARLVDAVAAGAAARGR